MAKLKHRKISSISLFSLAFLTPLAVSSCSEMPTGQINKPSQIEELKSDAAKIALLDSWLSKTLSSLMAKKIVNNNTSDEEKVSNTILYYLDYLKFPGQAGTTNLLDGTQVEVLGANDPNYSNSFRSFENDLKYAFNFYVSFKSTVASDSNQNPSLYFINNTIEWIKNKYETTEAAGGKTISDFKPTLSYGQAGNASDNDQDFKILMATRGTKIFQDVLKMMLAKMYFLDNNEQMIKNGTNFNKMTGDRYSLNYFNTLALINGNDDSQKDYKDYMLKKYLLDNCPSFQWSYSSEDYNNQTTLPSRISTWEQFNSLKTTKENTLNEFIAPNSNENDSNSLTKLQAFNSLANSSSNSDNNSNDLSNDIETIKTYGFTKQGLLDSNNNSLISFSSLETIKQAIEYNSDSNHTNKLAIPSIDIKESIKNDQNLNFAAISVSDIDVSWSSGNTQQDPNTVGKFTNGNQSLTINSVAFEPSKDEQKVTISFTYEFTDDNNVNHKLYYSFNILNWVDTGTNETNPFKAEYVFSGDVNQVGINIFDNDGASTGISYYLRILPIFERTSIRQIGSEGKTYEIGNFSFKNTPWDDENQQTKLVYFFILTNSDLYTQIQNFYLFNNFNIDDVSSDISIVSELGLTKKTNQDRKEEGII